MISATQTNCTSNCFVKLTEWTQKHPREATITAVACTALGIICSVIAAKVTLVSATVIALLVTAATAFSVSVALLVSYCANRKHNTPVETPKILQAPAPKKHIDRVAVMQETLQDLKKGYYTNPNGEKVDLTTGIHVDYFPNGSIQGQRLSKKVYPEGFQTPITVVPEDCLYVAQELCKEGLHPMVLDMANAFNVGGNYLGGARSQEEDICRRSALSIAIDPQHGIQKTNYFPLNPQEAPYAGLSALSVPVFRAGADKQYAYLDQPFHVDIGVVAAPCRPALNNINGELRINDADAALLRERIRTMLHMAHARHRTAVVLGAFGCGAFVNPPGHVAEIFKDVIEKEFAHCFEKIVFAILKDGNDGQAHNPEGNYLPFKRQFPT